VNRRNNEIPHYVMFFVLQEGLEKISIIFRITEISEIKIDSFPEYIPVKIQLTLRIDSTIIDASCLILSVVCL
jgi:hypothetical protein